MSAKRLKRSQDLKVFLLLEVLFTGLFLLVAFRASYLILFPKKRASLDQLAEHQYQRALTLAPTRGTLYDRKNLPLALSIRKPSLAINPRVFAPTPEQLSTLSKTLNIPTSKIKALGKKKRAFAWLKRHVDPVAAATIQKLNLEGLEVIGEPSRYYPAGSAAGHLVGFTGWDHKGLSGLEQAYDAELRGIPSQILAQRDGKGTLILDDRAGPERTGHHLVLTLDRTIQEIVEDELEKGLKEAEALSGFAIVGDPHSGKILAMASRPRFNPQEPVKIPGIWRNKALDDVFEPGSVTKPFILAYALELGVTQEDEVHDCDGGALKIGNHTIHDTHGAHNLTTEDVLITSSNICTYKIALKMGKEKTDEALRAFGFGDKKSSLNIPSQGFGSLQKPDLWSPIRFSNIAFGHGFLITGLELVQAMGAIANGGRLMSPMLVEKIIGPDGLILKHFQPQVIRNVISFETAQRMTRMIAKVVTDPQGTGSLARIKGYDTAGKTGTAQKVEPGKKGYAPGKYLASFIGFAPVQESRLVIYVLVDEPGKKPYYGGKWAAPIFAQIAKRVLDYLHVLPRPETEVSLNGPEGLNGPHGPHGSDGPHGSKKNNKPQTL